MSPNRSECLAMDLASMPFDVLRAERATARGDLEVARVRLRRDDAEAVAAAERLHSLVERMTDELILRYAADLDLVDSLLAEPYPRKVRDSANGGRRGTA